ncbi:hypothetical protein AN958_06293 [Leucoagaricus sp. SymC.cos]|nr:hypothetical protein AN958_06293 [Leucoagaricus sp. SymC.cos]
MPIDTPLVLTHNHDPKVVFRGQLVPQSFDSQEALVNPLSYDELWSNFQRMTRAYNDLLFQNKELLDTHQALQNEYNSLRDTYWSLHAKHQEFVDDAINSRIQSWRHVVRVEELEKELRLLKQGEAQLLSSKRKFTDVEDGDNDGAESDWSASSRSHSHSMSSDILNTPASGSSKIASAPLIKDGSSDDGISYQVQEITSLGGDLQGLSAEIRTPKRRRERASGLYHDRTPAEADTRRRNVIAGPMGKSTNTEDITLGKVSKRSPHARRSPPRTRLRTRSSRNRRSSVKEQNATAAAVAAALSEAAASHRSTSPSPPEQRSL